MKKIFLSFFAVGSFAAISIAQLPNPGFETWTSARSGKLLHPCSIK